MPRRAPAAAPRPIRGHVKRARSANRSRHVFSICACCVGLVARASLSSAAGNERWLPRGLSTTTATVADVRAIYERGHGPAAPDAEREETYHVTARGAAFDSTAVYKNRDYRITTTLAGSTYVDGRYAGNRWRRTPAGVVRIVATDAQGDDLERWPIALTGFDFADFAIVGQTGTDEPAYVLEDRTEGDVPHRPYVDERTGDVRREISRDGSPVVSFDFGNVRTTAGARRPYTWHIDADVDRRRRGASFRSRGGARSHDRSHVRRRTDRCENVPVLTVGFPYADGILGYEFFTGHVVHIDDAKRVVRRRRRSLVRRAVLMRALRRAPVAAWHDRIERAMRRRTRAPRTHATANMDRATARVRAAPGRLFPPRAPRPLVPAA